MYKVIRKDDNKLLGIEDSEFKAHDLIFFDIDDRNLGYLNGDDLDMIIRQYEVIEIEKNICN